MTGQHEINLGTMLLFKESEFTDDNEVSYLGSSNNILKFTVTDVPVPIML